MTLVVRLPWPDRALSPNARGHWSKRHRASQSARKMAWAVTRQQFAHPSATWRQRASIPLHFTFMEPNAHHRDDDNLLAMMKPYRDGIADALGVDDSRFEIKSITRTRKTGESGVLVEIET